MEGDSFDSILFVMGTGKWTVVYAAVISYWYSLIAYQLVIGAFVAAPVPHTCYLPPHAYAHTIVLPPNATSTPDNTTYNTTDPDTPVYDPTCNYLVIDNRTGHLVEEECTEWIFNSSTFSSTITSEFQLVCGRKYLRATYQGVYMLGMLVGAAFIGFLADRYGRLSMLSLSTLIFTIVGLGSAWLPSLPLLFTARFILGTMHPTSLQIGYMLVLEVTELKMRSQIGLTQFCPWAVGVMVCSAWAYLIRDWRWLQLAVSLPCLLFFPGLWFVGESPRWLAVVGQHQRALKELRRAAKWNKVTLPEDQELLKIMHKVQEQAVCNQTRDKEGGQRNVLRRMCYYITVLFRTPKMRLITVVTCLNQFVVSMLFFGLTLGASAMGVDPFVYVAIAGAVELPGSTLIVPLAARFGRRTIIVFSYVVCTISLLTNPLIPQGLHWLSIFLVMIGKMFSTVAINVVFLYSLELNPTEIRSMGMCASMLASRAGGIVAPYIMSALEDTYPWAISVLFGAAAAVAGVAVLPLWETRHTTLHDTVADLEGYTTADCAYDTVDTKHKSGVRIGTTKQDADGGKRLTSDDPRSHAFYCRDLSSRGL